ncbi:MAG: DUF4402 domain-containing protein [Pseudomonadota bacterium]
MRPLRFPFQAPAPARALAIWASAAAALLALPSGLHAQSVSSAQARGVVLDTVTLTNRRDMDFGRVIVPRNGRIDMTAQDTATCTANNGLTLLDPCQSAAFDGTAASGFQLRVTVPRRRRITLSGPGRNLRLRRMTVGAGNGLTFIGRRGRNFDFLITDPSGDFEFFVGGRLLFRNNQAPGLYSGTFTIQADYE